MSAVELQAVRKSFGPVEVIRQVDLAVSQGEFVVFVGPSGCGKSTLLRILSGLESASHGRITIDGRDVTRLPPGDRQVAMVFQSYALYPHMTAEENMSFGLRMTGVAKDVIRRRVAEAAAILQIEPLLQRKPKQLSGGQRQRVAIGRAIVRHPKVFLFDEPLSNLDAALRIQMRVEIARLHAEIGATMVYVTHDQVEAMTLADRIVVLNHGVVEQVGTPIELYERPANRFVAGFLGQPPMNFLEAVVAGRDGDIAALRVGPLTLVIAGSAGDGLAAGDRLTLGVRPDTIALDSASADALLGRVAVVEHLGSESLVYATVEGVADLVVVETRGKASFGHGDPVRLVLDPAACHLFTASGKVIPRGIT